MKIRKVKSLSETDFVKRSVPKPVREPEVPTVDETIGAITEEVKDDPFETAESSGVTDEIFEGIKEEPEEAKPTDLLRIAEEDMGTLDVASAEKEYKAAEIHKEAEPLIQTTVNTEVKKAVKLNNERIKLEVNEVLADEVGYRLDKYEKRRKFRQRKDFVIGVLKAVAVLIVVLFIFGNAQLRLRFQIIFKDIGDLVHGLVNNEEVTSNQLVEDMFRDLGDDLNDANTIIVEE